MTSIASDLVERLKQGVIILGHGPGQGEMIDVVTANQAMRQAAEALSQLTREVADYRSALSEAEDMLVRARDKRKLFGLQHAIEAVQAALSRSSGGVQ